MVVQDLSTLTTFTEFLEWKPEGGRYELYKGTIVEMQPTGKHEQITGFLATELTLEFRRLQLPYFIPKQVMVKVPDNDSCYSPDVILVNSSSLSEEPLWEKFSTVTKGSSLPLVIEVVSTNWRTDYDHKLVDYETLGIPEYWIVDYLGLGGKRHIGDPKQPTISVYSLVEDEYQVNQFQLGEVIKSPTLKDLNLTAEQVFNAGMLT